MQLANFPVIRKLAFLGFLVGIFTGGVIVLFRLLVETAQSSLLPDGNIENYEALDQLWIFLLPTMGGVVLGLLFHFLSPGYRAVGVVHVMERLRYFHGHLPMTNAVVQFFAAAISIVFGHSVGREGPAIHLGAACGSLLGLWQDLPNKAQRTLIASGMAAAIAASFNTPLAGVIFATEVILLEYTIINLVPVLVAAISATVFSQIVFGNEVILVPPQAIAHMQNAELLWVVVTGLVVGVVAMVFIRSIVWFSRISSALTILTRFSLAGVVTGVVALFVPAIMSLGWDTVQSTLSNEMLMATLLILLAAKLFATCFALGLGIPAGLIGPSLFIGAVCGAIMGLIAQEMWPGSVSEPGVYALIGMGAMMSASLHAPVAAIIAILELSYSPHISCRGYVQLFSLV